MKSALSEDVNIAARNVQSGNQSAIRNDVVRQESVDSTGKDGVFMVGLPVKRLSEMNLQKMGAECKYKTGQQVGDNHATRRKSSFIDSMHSDVLLKHSASLASFAELFTTPEFTARASRASSRAGSFSLDNPAMFNDSSEKNANEEPQSYATNQLSDPNVDTLLDDTIDSILESSSSDHEHQGRFLQDISKFLMDMKSPFQHVDLWVPMDMTQADNVGDIHVGNSSGVATTSGGKVNGVVYGEQQASTARLIHSGHITIPNSAPPHILQRLNEFGMYSKNFSFSPGYGTPGRVYLSGQPSWEANVSQAKPEQFARVGGAKIYGVNTVLGIPVSTHIGNMVVGLYSTSSLTIDRRFEQKCIDFFRILKPEPRWKLTIDVGLRREVDQSREKDALRLASTYNSSCNSPSNPKKIAPNKACIVPPSPTQNGNSSNDNKLHSWNEQSLALLLGKYMPLDLGSSSSPLNDHIANNSNVAEHLMSLRLLLLRHSSCRTALESNIVENIMERYRGYVRANQKESDLILLLVNDWKSFTSSTSVLSGPNVSTQSYYRSPSSLPITSTSYLGSVTSNEYNTTQPLVASSSNCYLQTGTIHPSGRQFSQPESTNGSDEHANLPPDFPYDLSCLGESTDEFRNEDSKCAHTAISNGNTSSNQHINDKNSSPFARVVSEQGPMEEQVLKEGI